MYIILSDELKIEFKKPMPSLATSPAGNHRKYKSLIQENKLQYNNLTYKPIIN